MTSRDGAREGPRRPGPGVHPGEELDVVARVGRVGGAHPDSRADAHERLADALDHAAVPRAEAKADVDPAPESAGRDERESPDPPISLEQQPLGDAAAERVPDEVEIVHPERVEPGADHLGVKGERVARVGARREPVPREVRRDHPTRPREHGRGEAPRRARVAEPVQEHQRPPLAELDR